MSPLNLSREDVEAVQRLRQLYPPHILASLFDNEVPSLLTPRESVSSYSSGSARSSVSSSPKNSNRNTAALYTSSIPVISERATSPNLYAAQSYTIQYKVPSLHAAPSQTQTLSRSVSDYALREHAFNAGHSQSQVSTSSSVYFCVHCGSGFERRPDWETHEWVSHERQSYWPCPQPGCQAFFDSGKAFEAHHQAVHGCGNCDHAARIVQSLPERQAWACGFKGCKEVFLDWSKRCKHVASHYEGLARRHGNFRESPEWSYTTTIRNLLRQPELKEQFRKFMVKCHGHSKHMWPALEWQPDKCAELQRCLEYRDFQRGIPDVVHMAYRLGHPAYSLALQAASRPPTPPQDDMLSPRPGSVRNARMRSRSVLSAMSGTTISPSSPNPINYRSAKHYLYERKLSSSIRSESIKRMSETPSFFSGKSLPDTPEATSPPRKRTISPRRAPPVLPSASTVRPSTATASRKRMVAREPEVRGTTSRALLDFLDDGPPTAPVRSEHRARQVPKATPLMPKQYDSFLSTDLDTFAYEPDRERSMVQEIGSPRISHPYDPSISPLVEYEEQQAIEYGRAIAPLPVSYQDYGKPLSPIGAPPSPTYPPPAPPTDHASDTVQETVLELKMSSFNGYNFGQKILPPTPGPPPTHSLPLPPLPAFTPPPTINFPDTPTSTVIDLDSLGWGEVPPSPMPPGFTDIDNWPVPPSVAPRSPSLSEHSERPRTANPVLQPEVVKLMPAPKRARSASRGRPRPLRWVNISDLMDQPMPPSPYVDYEPVLSQPLDATTSRAAAPAAVNAL